MAGPHQSTSMAGAAQRAIRKAHTPQAVPLQAALHASNAVTTRTSRLTMNRLYADTRAMCESRTLALRIDTGINTNITGKTMTNATLCAIHTANSFTRPTSAPLPQRPTPINPYTNVTE